MDFFGPLKLKHSSQYSDPFNQHMFISRYSPWLGSKASEEMTTDLYPQPSPLFNDTTMDSIFPRGDNSDISSSEDMFTSMPFCNGFNISKSNLNPEAKEFIPSYLPPPVICSSSVKGTTFPLSGIGFNSGKNIQKSTQDLGFTSYKIISPEPRDIANKCKILNSGNFAHQLLGVTSLHQLILQSEDQRGHTCPIPICEVQNLSSEPVLVNRHIVLSPSLSGIVFNKLDLEEFKNPSELEMETKKTSKPLSSCSSTLQCDCKQSTIVKNGSLSEVDISPPNDFAIDSGNREPKSLPEKASKEDMEVNDSKVASDRALSKENITNCTDCEEKSDDSGDESEFSDESECSSEEDEDDSTSENSDCKSDCDDENVFDEGSFIVFVEDNEIPLENCCREELHYSSRESLCNEDDKDADYDCDLFELDFDDSWGEKGDGAAGALHISALITTDSCDGNNFTVTASFSGIIVSAEVREANMKWDSEIDKNCAPSTPKRVTFSSTVNTVEVEHWERKGEWEMFARDRMRFKRRILEIEPKIAHVLRPSHREEIIRQRLDASHN